EMPRLRRMFGSLAAEQDLRVVLVSETSSERRIREFLGASGAALPDCPWYQVSDRERLRRSLGGVESQPLTLLLDRQGTVRQAFIGSLEPRRSELIESIERLLARVRSPRRGPS